MVNIQRDILGLKRLEPLKNDTQQRDKTPMKRKNLLNRKTAEPSLSGRKERKEEDNAESPFINRGLRGRDTFLDVFPAYGVLPDQKNSEVQRQYVYDFHPEEQRRTAALDKLFFFKKDDMKQYTEAWLRTTNMIAKR